MNELLDKPPETVDDVLRACNSHLEIGCYPPHGCGRIVFAVIRTMGLTPEQRIDELSRKMVCQRCGQRGPTVKGARPGSPDTRIPETYGGYRAGELR